MNIAQLFLQRYEVLYDFWLGGIWNMVPEDLMRQRPHARVNSIAWNLWHLTRVEDAGLNRFIAERAQVLDEGGWMERMNLPWRHTGSGMTFPEVDDLDQRINVKGLHDYSDSVHKRTLEIISHIDHIDLEAILQREFVRVVVLDEGLGYSGSNELVDLYSGWTKGKCLMNFGMTHPYQTVGEIGVIAGLLGVEF